MDKTSKWHNAYTDKPTDSATVLLRVEKGKNPGKVVFIPGYFSGCEYCDEDVQITHYDMVTHWIELPS